MEIAIKTSSRYIPDMVLDKEKSRSESTLLDDSISMHYGSLGIFETPTIPGSEQRCATMIISMNNSPQYASSISSTSSSYSHGYPADANHKVTKTSNNYSSDSRNSSIVQSVLSMIDVVNVSIGLAFLSLPYAIAIGGWRAIVGLTFIMLIYHHCCKIYTQLLNKRSIRSIQSLTNPSYPQLVFILSDEKTTYYYTILIFSILECIGISCIYIVFVWENLGFLLSRFDNTQLMISEKNNDIIKIVLSIIMILPALLILRIDKIYWLSYTTFIGAIILVFTVISFQFVYNQEYTQYTKLNHHQTSETTISGENGQGFVTSIGIFLFCFNSHSYSSFPVIQNNLKNSKLFKHILTYSHLCVFIIYALIGICGQLLYGEHTKPIILENIVQQKTEPNHKKNIDMFTDLLCIIFVICIWSSILPLILQISNFIECNVICEYLKNKQKHQTNTQIAQNYSHQIISKCLNQKKKHIMIHQKPSAAEESTLSNLTNNKRNSLVHTKNIILTNNTKRVCRIILLFIIFGIAAMFNNNITFFESMVGICFSSMTVIVFPYFLYLRYCWNSLACFNRLVNIFLFICIVILLTVLFIASTIDIL